MTKRKKKAPDVVDDIEAIAAKEIAELRTLIDKPDARLTDEVIGRLQRLLELVTAARKEQRDQIRWLEKLPPDHPLLAGAA